MNNKLLMLWGKALGSLPWCELAVSTRNSILESFENQQRIEFRVENQFSKITNQDALRVLRKRFNCWKQNKASTHSLPYSQQALNVFFTKPREGLNVADIYIYIKTFSRIYVWNNPVTFELRLRAGARAYFSPFRYLLNILYNLLPEWKQTDFHMQRVRLSPPLS